MVMALALAACDSDVVVGPMDSRDDAGTDAGEPGRDGAVEGDAGLDDGGAPDAGSHAAAGGDGGTDDPGPARPRIVAYTGSGALRGVAADDGPLDIGHQFTVSHEDLVVEQLGVWDEAADGLARPHTLALFSLDQLGADAIATPLPEGSVVVPAGTTAQLEDGFRFAALERPLGLPPGHYALIAFDMDADDPYGNGGTPPVPASGLVHGSFEPFEFTSAADFAYPASGNESLKSSVSMRFSTGEPPPLRIMPLGDSITFGFNSAHGGYRATLAGLLEEAGVSFQFVGSLVTNPGALPLEQTHHEGRRGYVIRSGSSGWDGLHDQAPDFLGPSGARPDVILLMIGTNDVRLDYQHASAEARLDDFVTLLMDGESGLAPHARLLVAQLTPFADPAKDAQVRTFNEGVARVVAKHQAAGRMVELVDMHGALGVGDLSDALHPNEAGYRKLAAEWFDALGL
jgi:lysophospholipase L1-like esterase